MPLNGRQIEERQSRTKMTCNIDAKGKAVRLIYGVILLIVAALLIVFWAIPTGGILRWSISAICAAMGAFSIFEARAGWCVIRAMGMKTPM
jgi:fatty acid desaturase